jgi:hypothetical protein
MSEFDLQHSNGIKLNHLSPSTITSFISYRHSWYASKVARKPFQPSRNMARGTSVEHAINEWLEDKINPEDIVHTALNKYDDEISDWITTTKQKYVLADDEVRATIPGLANVAHAHYSSVYNDFRKPVLQHNIELYLPGVTRKLVGKLDYYYPKDKEIRDCKVVASTPPKGNLAQNYKIQGSIYRKACDDADVIFDFMINNKTPKQMSIKLTDEDYIFGLSYATVAAKLIEELEICEDPKRVMQIMTFPDLSSMYDIGEMRESAKEWGIFLP